METCKQLTWRANPIRNRILVALVKRKGEIIDDDLLRVIQKSDQSITKELIERHLMALEILGIVSISQITKTRKRIKLINESQLNKEVLFPRP